MKKMKTNKNPTQCERVLDYLSRYGSITQLEALADLGIMRLASRVSELNKEGYNIGKRMIKRTNRYGEKVSFAEYYFDYKEGEQIEFRW